MNTNEIDVDKLRHLIDLKYTQAELSSEFNCSERKIRYWLDRYNLKTLNDPKPRETVLVKERDKQIIELFNQGYGARVIANKLSIDCHGTISKRLIKLGLKQNKTNGTEISKNKSEINFKFNEIMLSKAAEDYFKFICKICGYHFCIPSSDAPYDLLIQINGNFKKIQVKSSYNTTESGGYVFHLKRTRNNTNGTKKVPYTRFDTDYFFLIDAKMNCWLIPFEEIKGKGTVTPLSIYPGFKINIFNFSDSAIKGCFNDDSSPAYGQEGDPSR